MKRVKFLAGYSRKKRVRFKAKGRMVSFTAIVKSKKRKPVHFLARRRKA